MLFLKASGISAFLKIRLTICARGLQICTDRSFSVFTIIPSFPGEEEFLRVHIIFFIPVSSTPSRNMEFIFWFVLSFKVRFCACFGMSLDIFSPMSIKNWFKKILRNSLVTSNDFLTRLCLGKNLSFLFFSRMDT